MLHSRLRRLAGVLLSIAGLVGGCGGSDSPAVSDAPVMTAGTGSNANAAGDGASGTDGSSDPASAGRGFGISGQPTATPDGNMADDLYLRSLTPTGQGDIRLPDGTYITPGETPPNLPMPP